MKLTWYHLLVFGLFFIIIAYPLFSHGMFMDGLFYSTISRNLSVGIGTFWNPVLTETIYNPFHEHPPLAFGIQSVFFYLFGDSFLVERIYSLLTFIISGWLIILIWNSIIFVKERKYSWYPLLLWIVIGQNLWCVRNNMLENTMMVFILSTVLCLVKNIETDKFIYLVLAGISLFLATMTKGLVALYPLMFYLYYFLFFKRINLYKFVIKSFQLVVILLIPYVLIYFFYNEAYESLNLYFNKQVIKSLKSVTSVDSRFFIIGQLAKELTLPIIISGFVYVFSKRFSNNSDKEYNPWVFVFIVIGLSGVLPIMISMKQRGFYILTVYPFFAIGISLFTLSNLKIIMERLFDKIRFLKTVKWLSIFLLLIGLIISAFATYKNGRNGKLIEDVNKIYAATNNVNILSIGDNVKKDWSLYGYMFRFYYVSLERDKYKSEFLITKKGKKIQKLDNYIDLDLNLNLYSLYKKKNYGTK